MAGDVNIQVEDDAVVDVVLPEGMEAPSLKDLKDAATRKTEEKIAPAGDATDEAAAALAEARKATDDERRRREASDATANAERARATQAEHVAARAAEDARNAREAMQTNEMTSVLSRIENGTKTVESAKTEFTRAMEAGEFAKAADAQAKLSEAQADLSMARSKKTELETAPKPQPHEGRVEQQFQKSPFERYITESNFSPLSQSWLRSHPDCAPAQFGGNPEKNAKMMAGHYEALARNITQGSSDYYKVIEDKIDGTSEMSAASKVNQAGDADAAAPQRQQRKTPVPAAPASRDPPSADGTQRSTTVRLTPQEQEVALFSYTQKQGEDDAAWKKRAFGTYASEKVQAQAEGRIGRLTH